jgi:preprotein translocase subunit YajC
MFEKIAYAAPAAEPSGESPVHFLLMMGMVMLVFYFLMIRPQQKRHKELQKLISDLKKGDRVVTAGGIIGTIASVQNDYIVLKIGDNENTKMEVLKSAVSGLRQ